MSTVPPTSLLTGLPILRGPGGRELRVAHLTTVDMSLALLLATELAVDVETGLRTFAISAPGPYTRDVEATGAEPVPVESLTRAWDPKRDAAAARELLAVVRRLRLDVLHTHNPKTGILGRVLGRLARVPVVVNTCHGLWVRDDDPIAKRALVLGAEAAAAWFSHAELYQNHVDRDTLRRLVPPGRSQVVGNGIDLTRFSPGDPATRAAVRAEWGVGEGDVVVGAVGRRVLEKGLAELADAASRLGARARFVWVGPEDPDKPDAVARIGSAVQFAGARTDMPAVYAALDVFALPSYREGFSRSAMEAAAAGLPLVLSDIRGCREIGRPEVEALFVPAGDAPALARAIERLVGDPALRARLGAAARARALSTFDQRQVAAASLRTYAAVARRRDLGWEVS